MVLLAFSLQEQVEKYGVYVGIAAFFGLAVLTLLYFAQAREVKRLREWAGRAPERLAELEGLADELREAASRAPAPQPAVQRVAPQPAPAQAANGTARLKPEEVAALAFARAAGVHEPHEPRPHHAPAAAAAVAAPPTQAVEAPAPSANGGGHGAPPPATPAARRGDAPPATPAPRRADAPPPRRPAGAAAARRAPAPPPRRGGGSRSVVLVAVIAALVLAAAAFAVTQLGGGDEQARQPNEVPPATETAEPAAQEPTATPAPPDKESVRVMVFNGTTETGLAARQRDTLQNDGYPQANLEVGDVPEAQLRATSIVMYRRGAKPAADLVAESLGIEEVGQINDQTQALLADTGKDFDVVVIVGLDKR